MDAVWICVVINRNLCARGEETVRREMQALAGDYYVDFRMEEGFDGDAYSFLKSIEGMPMDSFRRASGVVAILESYDNPSYLTDEEVIGFVEREEEVMGTKCGDEVLVGGTSPYSGLHGVVSSPGAESSEVAFRLHTVSRREVIGNEELEVLGNVFSRLKIPVVGGIFMKRSSGKTPYILEGESVDTSELNRGPH